MNDSRKRQYFAELAPNYSTITSNTTRDIFATFLTSHAPQLHLSSSSIIHDNACGPGTATQVLIQHATTHRITPTIIATDYAPAMIDTLRTIQTAAFPSNPLWTNVTSQILDSSDLSTIPDQTFTHSISNFSLFTISDPIASLRETHRTLKPNGHAIILLWKKFTIQNLLAAAQDHIKGDGYAASHAVPVNGPLYYERDTVRLQLVEAGFEGGKVQMWQVDGVVRREDVEGWEGMVGFMVGTSVAGGSMKGWSEGEMARWEGAVRWALEGEAERGGGGVRFEAWVNVVRK